MKKWDKFAAVRPQKRQIGVRADGRPIWSIGGASPDGDPPEDQHDEDQDGDDEDDSDDDLDLIGGGDSDDEDEDDGEDDPVDRIVAAVEKRLGERFDSIADRRVNALLKEQRKRPVRQESRGQQVSAADRREARAVYREFIGDEVVRFVGAAEREFAADLAAGMFATRLVQGADPEDVGREVAKDVAKQVKATRKMYQSQTMKTLEARGAIDKSKLRATQPAKKGGAPGPASTLKKGADIAREMYPERFGDK